MSPSLDQLEKLRRRNTEMAGRLRRKQAWQDSEVRTDSNGDWYRLLRAIRYLKEDGLTISKTTLIFWAGLEKKRPEKRKRGCPYLPDRACIQHKPFEAAFGRREVYLLKVDLDHILSAWRARTAQRADPEYPGLIWIGALAEEMGLKPKTIRKLYRKWCASRGKRPVTTRKPARSAVAGDGHERSRWHFGERAIPRSYLPETFATWFRQRHTLESEPDDINVREASKSLGCPENTVRILIAQGQLHPKEDKQTIVCRGGYRRPGLVLSRKEVLGLRQGVKAGKRTRGSVGLRRPNERAMRRRVQALAVLRELLPIGRPQLRNEVVKQAVARGVSLRLVYWAKGELKVKTTGGRTIGPGYWTRHAGATPAPAEAGQMPPPPAATQSDAGEVQPKRRGRPSGTIDPDVARRKRQMLEEWDQGNFNGNKAAAGRAHGFHRSDATKIINVHARKKSRK
jgi:hypothetical protein